MATVTVSRTRELSASAATVYGYIADFREHHPRFLPPAFANLAIEQGGVGAGTVLRFDVTLAGRRRAVRSSVMEPEPGRVLHETDLLTGALTTFTVDPAASGCRVTIDTVLTRKAGFEGWLESWMAPWLLGRLYDDELARLADYAARAR